MVAVLSPDDDWHEFILQNPSLSELRKRIKTYPGADLQTVTDNMIEAGIIADTVKV